MEKYDVYMGIDQGGMNLMKQMDISEQSAFYVC